MSGSAIAVCLAGVFVAILLNHRFDVNMGVTGMVFSWIVGCFFLGLTVREVIGLWPVTIVFQLMSITMFFSFAVVNGTMNAVANHMLYLVRNQTWMIAFAIYFVSILMGLIGCPAAAGNAIMALISCAIGIPAGLHPVIILWAVVHGTNMGACAPWAANGSIIIGTIAANGFEEAAASYTVRYWIAYFVVTTIILVGLYLLLKGYKVKTVNVEKPEPFTVVQKRNLIIIGFVIALVVLPVSLGRIFHNTTLQFIGSRLDIQMLCQLGFLLCTLLHIAKPKDAISSVPWGTVIMLGGIGALMNVAGKAGMTELLSGWLNSNIPEALYVAFMSMLAGFMSFFSYGIATVFPMLTPMGLQIVGGTAIQPVTMIIAILMGAVYTGISPFSTGGAVFMANCTDEEARGKLFGQELAVCFVSLVVVVVFGAVGFYSWL